MAFIVEDGTGVPDANSYASVEFADAYFNDRGIAAWEGTAEQKQGWLVQATDYADTRFGERWIGVPAYEDQGLHFPVKDMTGMPVNLLKAIAEYALRAKTGPLAPDPTVDASGFSVVTARKKVGPIEKEFRVMGADGSKPLLFRPYPAADRLLIGLLRPTGRRVIR
jgi:hypothetical protein